MQDYSQEEIRLIMMEIEVMTHEEMARLYRFTPSGSPIFRSDLPLYEKFITRFNSFGGMTTEMSQKIGWR